MAMPHDSVSTHTVDERALTALLRPRIAFDQAMAKHVDANYSVMTLY